MIKAIFFDYNGVIGVNILKCVYAETAKRFGLTKEDVRQTFHEIHSPAQRGETSVMEFWERFAAKFGIDPKELEKVWLDIFASKSIEDEEVLDLIKNLKANGYKIGMLTNLTNAFPSTSRKNLACLFDDIVISCEVGMRKPEPEIYELALKRLGIKADDAVFIDDRYEYVEGANAVGIKGILFENAVQLKRELEKLGVKID